MGGYVNTNLWVAPEGKMEAVPCPSLRFNVTMVLPAEEGGAPSGFPKQNLQGPLTGVRRLEVRDKNSLTTAPSPWREQGMDGTGERSEAAFYRALSLQHHSAVCVCREAIREMAAEWTFAAPSIVFVEWLLNCLPRRHVRFSSSLSFYVVLVAGLSWRPVSLLSF